MIPSLLMKLAMLAMTAGVVFWIGWQAPQTSLKAAGAGFASEATPGSVPAPDPAGRGSLMREHVQPVPVTPDPVRTRKAVPPQQRLLDLNHVGAEELESLPGVGAVLAQRVIDYRRSAGGFRSIDDLRRVKGIGAKKLDRLRPFVMVSAGTVQRKTEKSPL